MNPDARRTVFENAVSIVQEHFGEITELIQAEGRGNGAEGSV